jgi:hypothetical protein
MRMSVRMRVVLTRMVYVAFHSHPESVWILECVSRPVRKE